jgi:predicted HAD superfamily Cof-like phosphohydrolase
VTVRNLDRIDKDCIKLTVARAKSPHQLRVEAFMHAAQQAVPNSPQVPADEIRLCRARLIYEEALETINAMGVQVEIAAGDNSTAILNSPKDATIRDTEMKITNLADLQEVADGCADLRVVTTGTLSAFGIADELLQEEVDYNNLEKFGKDYCVRSDGKIIKSPQHRSPDLGAVLDWQRKSSLYNVQE